MSPSDRKVYFAYDVLQRDVCVIPFQFVKFNNKKKLDLYITVQNYHLEDYSDTKFFFTARDRKIDYGRQRKTIHRTRCKCKVF